MLKISQVEQVVPSLARRHYLAELQIHQQELHFFPPLLDNRMQALCSPLSQLLQVRNLSPTKNQIKLPQNFLV